MNLSGRKVLITGASSGIGRALAGVLARRGCALVITGRDEERLQQAADEANADSVRADLASPGAVEELAEAVLADHPDLSILVNNAAVQLNYDVAEAVRENAGRWVSDAEREVRVNLVAPVQLAGLLFPHLRAAAERTGAPSAIVNVTSGLALAPKKTAPVYCATKAGLRVFGGALRYQAEDAVQSGAGPVLVVEAMLPLVDTPMTAGRESAQVEKMTPHAVAEEIADGLTADRTEIRVGKAKLFGALHRVLPGLAKRMLRDG